MYNDFKKRNAFSQDPDWIGTCKMGQLVPVDCREVVPGDVFANDQEIMLRLAPMLAPSYTPVDVYAHHFFVPHRILWDNWRDFITGGKDGKNNSVRPYLMSGVSGFAVGSTADYLGIPPNVPNLKVSALQFRALAMIYNYWYRNETLDDELAIGMGDGLDSTTVTQLPNRKWRKGRFESLLPWPQRGDPIYLPLGEWAPVYGDGQVPYMTQQTVGQLGGAYSPLFPSGSVDSNQRTNVMASFGSTTPDSTKGMRWPTRSESTNDNVSTGLRTDLSVATAVTPDQVRTAFQIQLAQVLNARGGYRYPEFIKTHFGVTTSDARMQWPEYLGGGRCPVSISEILQTSSTDNTSPQGNMSGHGFALTRVPGYKKSFEEYGYVFTIVSILPKATYSQGLAKMWTRETRYDEYLPVYSHLGEQAVEVGEIRAVDGTEMQSDGITPKNKKTFGFEPRYEEFRRFVSTAHGQFRVGQSLDFWTQQRYFETEPVLNSQFVTADPSKRIFAVTDENVDEVYLLVRNHFRMIRPLPKYGTPGLMDHF